MNKPQATGLTDPGFRYCHTVFVFTIYRYNVRAYIIFKLHNPSRKKHAVRAFLMAKTNIFLGEDKHLPWPWQTFVLPPWRLSSLRR